MLSLDRTVPIQVQRVTGAIVKFPPCQAGPFLCHVPFPQSCQLIAFGRPSQTTRPTIMRSVHGLW